ncbi:ribonuclease HI family protein [Candidatus Microgenomates bacterium]|nr:ribonuclease HI family protein [Candidatus Microgenomates bacterium]
MIHHLYSDGGSRGNPGKAAGAFVIKKDEKIVAEGSIFLGTATNNKAEYAGLILGLEKLSSLTKGEVRCFLDSELVVKQLKGEYRIKDEGLKPLFAKVVQLKNNFEKITFTHIRREKNKEADFLVNKELDNN